MEPIIVVTNVSKSFRRYHADRPGTIQEAVAKGLRRMRTIERFWGLRDVSFNVGAGKTVGIIGSNGSGKSTLLRLIGGVGRPDVGQIDVRGRIGALLDLAAGFHPELTGRENAVLAGILNGLTRKQVLQRLESIVAFAEIEKALDNPVRTYSSGMQMRLAFSVAVHTEPEVLLIDEVLSVGDISFQRKCRQRIAQFKASGCTILLVSHVGKTIEDLCDETVWLHKGVLMAEGKTPDVVGQYTAHMAKEASFQLPLPSSSPVPISKPASPEEEGETYPVVSQPPLAIRTPGGTEIIVDERRFGSMEVEIRTVRVLDANGQPVSEVLSGQPIQIEMDYVAKELVVGPIFCVRIDREDGTRLFGLNALGPPMSLMEIHGPGRVAVHLNRLDLNTGIYGVTVACFAQDWAYAYDRQDTVLTITVKGEDNSNGLLSTPHHWEIKVGAGAEPAVPGGMGSL